MLPPNIVIPIGLGPQRWPRRGELRRLRELVAELEGQASPLSTEAAQAIRLAYGLGPAEAAEEESG